MNTAIAEQVEHDFLALPQAERRTIISYGAAFLLAELRKRLFFAESKVHYFEDKYSTQLINLDADGLPDEAGVEMHEDYIMWHHWTAVASQVRDDIAVLQAVATPRVLPGDLARVGD